MSALITSSLISAGGSLLGGIFGKSKRRSTVPNFAEMRDKARAAGFNPLTALRATGGGIAPAQALSPLSTRAAIGNAIQQFGGTYAQGAIAQETAKQAQEDWKARWDYQIANPQNTRFAPAVPALSNRPGENAEKTGYLEPGETVSQTGAIFPFMDHRIKVRLPNGAKAYILADHADRYQIKPGSMLTVGDLAELSGEIMGEGSAILQPKAVLDNLLRTGVIYENKTGESNQNPVRARRRSTGGK